MKPDRFWQPAKIPDFDAEAALLGLEEEWSGGPTFSGFMSDKRRQLGLTQVQLAGRMQDLGRTTPQPSISRWEKGVRKPDGDVLWYLFTALQLLPYERLLAIELLAAPR